MSMDDMFPFGYVNQYDHCGLDEDGFYILRRVRAEKALFILPTLTSTAAWGCDHCGEENIRPVKKQVDYSLNCSTGERKFEEFYVCNKCTGDLNLWDLTTEDHIEIPASCYEQEDKNDQ
jgi:predicted RNA-binding Zn-ribbon protein involved in translation (DUF1610 family)